MTADSVAFEVFMPQFEPELRLEIIVIATYSNSVIVNPIVPVIVVPIIGVSSIAPLIRTAVAVTMTRAIVDI